MLSASEFLHGYYRTRLNKDKILYGEIDGKEVGVIKMWEREDSCSQCITEYCNYFLIKQPGNGILRGYMNEFLPSKELLEELREEYANAKRNF